ncbi:MAG: ATP synthase F1 subunit gamma [Armatimonadetes bacterium CG07_land_8_20_14_0_80_40_9]|nr:MAG: ATP synthase F1 subunit gamma [Armatimonadetes bacterium CG07_land_8_20_14_0_80_40_9]
MVPESLRDIKRRIRSVQNTQQITKAMEMVAAARLRRVQAKVHSLRSYLSKMEKDLSLLLSRVSKDFSHPLLSLPPQREKSKIALIVISSERGLCGGYNSNLIRSTTDFLKSLDGKKANLMVAGRKANNFLERSAYKERVQRLEVSIIPVYKELRLLVPRIVKSYREGEFEEVDVLWTKFISTPRHEVMIKKYLPVEVNLPEEKDEGYIFEPAGEKMLDDLLSLLLGGQIYQFFLESKASEEASRMISMRAATDNASDMIDNLTLSYNKARQAGITRELLEVVSGAEALK